jgi:hypothetical protein
VQFTSVSTGIAPAQDNEYFRVGITSGSKIVPTDTGPIFSASQVGNGTNTIGFFENNEGGSGAGGGDMDAMAPGDVRHMYTYFRLPPVSTVIADQDIQYTLSVRAGP